MAIHQSNYYRAARGRGEQFIIPLCDHVLGLGKTEFSLHYIRVCRKSWALAKRTDFQEALHNCHMIRVVLPYGSLIKAASMDSEICMRLTRALQDSFRVVPQCLAEKYESSEDLLVAITRVVGPLFIVLDEMGAGFASKEHAVLKQREKFLEFCQEVLGSWLVLKNIFLLLIGHGSFFSDVGRRPEIFSETEISPSGYKFERLPLRLLKQT